MAVTVNVNLKANAGGTVNAITADFTPDATLTDKRIVFVRAAGANTSSAVTLNTDGSGAKNVKRFGGQDLFVGDISGANHELILMYNLSGTYWELLNPAIPIISLSVLRKKGTVGAEIWHSSATSTYAPGVVSLSANVIRAMPFMVGRSGYTADRIAMEVTSAGSAGSLVRIGIYNSTNVIPDTLVLDAGTIAGDSVAFQPITISQALPIGLYWLVFVHNASGTIGFRSIPANTGIPAVLGEYSALGSVNRPNHINNSFAYAALPSSFPMSGASITALNVAVISLRFSA